MQIGSHLFFFWMNIIFLFSIYQMYVAQFLSEQMIFEIFHTFYVTIILYTVGILLSKYET